MRAASRRDEGAAAVEFALLLIPLLLILFGIMSFGLYFAGSLGLSNASREAARYGVVQNRTCSDISVALRDSVQGTIGIVYPINFSVTRTGGTTACSGRLNQPVNGQPSTITITSGATSVPCRGSKTNADELTVSTAAKANLIVPLWFTSNNFPLNGKGVYRCEFS
jgi:Flp pilus assembly protein TadG